MKLTLRFECAQPTDKDTTREISARNRTPADLDTVITRWKQAYANESGEPPRVILCDTGDDLPVAPDAIESIDEIRM